MINTEISRLRQTTFPMVGGHPVPRGSKWSRKRRKGESSPSLPAGAGTLVSCPQTGTYTIGPPGPPAGRGQVMPSSQPP